MEANEKRQIMATVLNLWRMRHQTTTIILAAVPMVPAAGS
jgi:hypothetical protein